MAVAGGKGKISNELVAASCAAVLAVYAAGYWRTRDAARGMEARSLERRPARPVPTPVATQPAIVEPAAAAAPAPGLPPDAPVTAAAAPAAAAQVASGLVASTVATKPTAPATVAAAAPASSSPAVAAPTVAAAPEAITKAAVAVASTAEPAPAATTLDILPAPTEAWRDGVYTGWGTSRHGDIKAQVIIQNGRIVDASIVSCETRYPCDVISHIIRQPVDRQSPDVDRVSRATESADAYYYGLVEALTQAYIAPAGEAAAPQ